MRRGWLLAALLLAACGQDPKDPIPTQPEGCDPACAEGESCVEGACVPDEPPPPDLDGDGVADAEDRCPSSLMGADVDEQGCTFEEAPVAFSEGPYGIGIRETAGDFTVETTDGPWNLREGWTGNDSLIFLVHQAGSAYSDGLWRSSVYELLRDSPPSAHYFFLSVEADPAADVADLETRFDEARALFPPDQAAAWESRLHFVTTSAFELDGALGEFFTATPAFHFAVDRFQRWREVGSLFDWVTRGYPMRFLTREVEGFEYERRLERKLGALDATVVTVMDGDRHVGGWNEGYATTVEATFPSAEEMARFDSMAVRLYTACPGHLQGKDAGCNEWDYAHHLFLCDVDDPTRCETELVRYVTPYGREGEWLTDISSLLPLLKDGGARKLKYTGANGYEMHLDFVFWDAGKPTRPVEARFLWGASGAIPWNEGYNARFEPVTFVVDDPSTVMVEIYSVVTGHGFGSTNENCAEFCNSEHEFTVNEDTFTESHPEAVKYYGCYDKVAEGVVPNQFGSWPFGRAGWCPGQDVKPWVQDVTPSLVSGENTIAYRALYRGEPYSPVPNGQGDYMPELRLGSWLVLHEKRN